MSWLEKRKRKLEAMIYGERWLQEDMLSWKWRWGWWKRVWEDGGASSGLVERVGAVMDFVFLFWTLWPFCFVPSFGRVGVWVFIGIDEKTLEGKWVTIWEKVVLACRTMWIGRERERQGSGREEANHDFLKYLFYFLINSKQTNKPTMMVTSGPRKKLFVLFYLNYDYLNASRMKNKYIIIYVLLDFLKEMDNKENPTNLRKQNY